MLKFVYWSLRKTLLISLASSKSDLDTLGSETVATVPFTKFQANGIKKIELTLG
jgi:hypothetical protein